MTRMKNLLFAFLKECNLKIFKCVYKVSIWKSVVPKNNNLI